MGGLSRPVYKAVANAKAIQRAHSNPAGGEWVATWQPALHAFYFRNRSRSSLNGWDKPHGFRVMSPHMQLIAVIQIQYVYRSYMGERTRAATLLQSRYRKLVAQRLFLTMKRENALHAQHWLKSRQEILEITVRNKLNKAASIIQTAYRGHRIRRLLHRNRAACKIQSAFRGHKIYQQMRRHKAATKLQEGYRGKMARRRLIYLLNKQAARRAMEQLDRKQHRLWECSNFLCILPFEQDAATSGHSRHTLDTSKYSDTKSSNAEVSWEWSNAALWEPKQMRHECRNLLTVCELTDSPSEKDGYISILL
jgi:hypothetical protein